MFKGMEYVYAVWKEQSFSAAAKKLYITQPALSNSVKRVEDKIGFPIFDRTTSPIQLTAVGKEYIRTVEQIMTSEENFSHFLEDTKNLCTGEIVIGSGAMVSSCILPELISRYKKKFPYVNIDVKECGEKELIRRLAEGEIDLAIENSRFPDSLFARWLFCLENTVLAVPEVWEVNKELVAWQQRVENIVSGIYKKECYPTVPLERFRDLPFVLLDPADENYERALALCQDSGFVPHVLLTLNQQLTAYHMACAGLGAAFVSDTLVKNAIPNPQVVFYKLKPEMARREICFYYKKGRYMPRCVEEFIREAGVIPEESPGR